MILGTQVYNSLLETRSTTNFYMSAAHPNAVRSALKTFAVGPDGVSDEMESMTDSGSQSIVKVWSDTPRLTVTATTPATYRSQRQEDWIEFRRLVAGWGIQRSATPSLATIVLCEAYQSILGMGKRAVPLILRQIQSAGEDPDHWF